MAGHHCRDRRQVGDDVNTLWRRLDKTLNPKPLNPKPLNPKSAEKEAWGAAGGTSLDSLSNLSRLWKPNPKKDTVDDINPALP